jgi:hypothetical protein
MVMSRCGAIEMPKLRKKQPSATPRETLDLWPEAGEQLGLSRNATYALAQKGEFPGAKKFLGRWIVFKRPFQRALNGE